MFFNIIITIVIIYNVFIIFAHKSGDPPSADFQSINQSIISNQLYQDLNVTCDGFVSLLLYCHYHNLFFTAHFFTSEPCEHGFGYVRIGRNAGRRTNVSADDLCTGFQRKNRAIEVEADIHSFKPVPIARTRSRTILGGKKDENFIICHARSVSIGSIVSTMNDATDYCAWMCSKLPGVSFKSEIEDDFDANSIRGKYKLYDHNVKITSDDYSDPFDQWSDGEDDVKKNTMPSQSDYIVVNGKHMSLKTAAAIYGNGGYTRLTGQSRASRFLFICVL